MNRPLLVILSALGIIAVLIGAWFIWALLRNGFASAPETDEYAGEALGI